jgi:hypothetical protein
MSNRREIIAAFGGAAAACHGMQAFRDGLR